MNNGEKKEMSVCLVGVSFRLPGGGDYNTNRLVTAKIIKQ